VKRYFGPWIQRCPCPRQDWFIGWRVVTEQGGERLDMVGTLRECLTAAINFPKVTR
jgi:hypothetical protein